MLESIGWIIVKIWKCPSLKNIAQISSHSFWANQLISLFGCCSTLQEIGLHAQSMIIIVSPPKNKYNWNELYDHFMSMEIHTLIMSKIFIRSPSITRKVAMP